MLVRQDEQFTWDSPQLPQSTAAFFGLDSQAAILPAKVSELLSGYNPVTGIHAMASHELSLVAPGLGVCSVAGTSYAANITTPYKYSSTSLTADVVSFETADPLTNVHSTSGTLLGLLETPDPLAANMNTNVTWLGGSSQSTTVSSTTGNVDFVFEYSPRGIWHTITLPFKRAVKKIITALKAAFHGAGDWINQFAILAFVRSRPRVLLN